VDVAAATERGIPVTNVPDTFIEEVADHTIMLILATFRRLITMDRLVRESRWSEGRPLLSNYPRLIGQTLGLISFGHVARATALRAKPFGLRMLAHDPYIEELTMTQYGVEPVGLSELLQRSDIISMHAPSTPEVHHMLTEEHFRLMKPQVLFINNGRGPTVDEKALIRALQEGWIAAAGLDVLEQEPPDPENPLLHMDNVILTPHVASASARMGPETRRRVGHRNPLQHPPLPYALAQHGLGLGQLYPRVHAQSLLGVGRLHGLDEIAPLGGKGDQGRQVYLASGRRRQPAEIAPQPASAKAVSSPVDFGHTQSGLIGLALFHNRCYAP